MFTDSSIRDLEVGESSPFVKALTDKLLDIDKNRIHATDDLVMRKAVLGLLSVVAELERRLVAVEGPAAREEWTARLSVDLGMPTPDEVRLGED